MVVFDQTHSDSERVRTIVVQNNTHLEWYGLTTGRGHYSLHFVHESGESIVRMLLLANNTHTRSTVRSTLSVSHTLTNIHIISLVGNAGTVTLNGIVEINSGIEKVSGHILEENIFLGSQGQIQ